MDADQAERSTGGSGSGSGVSTAFHGERAAPPPQIMVLTLAALSHAGWSSVLITCLFQETGSLDRRRRLQRGGGANREPLRDEGAPTCTSPQLVLDQQVVHAAAASEFWRVQEDQDDVHVIGRDLSETLRGWRRTL